MLVQLRMSSRKQRLRWVRNKERILWQIHLVLRFMPVISWRFAGRAKNPDNPRLFDGEQAFLAQHENIVAAIIPGEMRFEEADGTKACSGCEQWVCGDDQ